MSAKIIYLVMPAQEPRQPFLFIAVLGGVRGVFPLLWHLLWEQR